MKIILSILLFLSLGLSKIASPVLEILGDNYNGTTATNTGTQTSKNFLEVGTVATVDTLNSRKYITIDADAGDYLKSQSTETGSTLYPLTDGAIEMVIRPAAIAGTCVYLCLADTGTTNSFYYYTSVATGIMRVNCIISSTSQYQASSPASSLSATNFTHVIFTGGDTEKFQMYINGSSVTITWATVTDTNSFIENVAPATIARTKWNIGRLNDSTPYKGSGADILYIRIYNQYLDQVEVTQNYNAYLNYFTPSETESGAFKKFIGFPSYNGY